jgi:hypothetical protein
MVRFHLALKTREEEPMAIRDDEEKFDVGQDDDEEFDGSNEWDYLQWSVWGSNNPAESSGAWTLLWDPTATSGSTNDNFVVTTVNGAATSAKIYRYGDPAVGNAPGSEHSDAFTIDLNLAMKYRYFGIRASTIAVNDGNSDPEINAVATIAPPHAPSVGGYWFPIDIDASAKPLIPHLALIAILAIGFIAMSLVVAIRRKTHPKAR